MAWAAWFWQDETGWVPVLMARRGRKWITLVGSSPTGVSTLRFRKNEESRRLRPMLKEDDTIVPTKEIATSLWRAGQKRGFSSKLAQRLLMEVLDAARIEGTH